MSLSESSAIVSWGRRRWQILVLGGLILCFPIFIKSYFITRIGIVLALYAITITGITLLIRYAGVISLGHSAFFALGAYISAILTVRAGWNAWLSMVVAGGAAVVFAYLFSVPFLKLRRVYLAMATLGLGEVAHLLAKDLSGVTGGVSTGIPDPHFIYGVVLRRTGSYFIFFGCFVNIFCFDREYRGHDWRLSCDPDQ
jgi:branched-chain amino acid transport system permease protein